MLRAYAIALTEVWRKLWFRDTREQPIWLNDTAVRIRAGILLIIPLYMGWTLFDVAFTSNWVVTGNFIEDTFDTDFDDHILYRVEAYRRTYEYSFQTKVLFYALFEMIAGMFVFSSHFSPTIWLATFLARGQRPHWKPLVPKRFAWSIGASLISVCLVFFNPDTFAHWVNTVWGSELLPETVNYMPRWIPVSLIWVCFGFMWLETVLGFCVGCKVHALLVGIGLMKDECEACNNLSWD